MKCALCDRELNEQTFQKHHLIPKMYGGKELVDLHPICHQKIHATFSENELAKYYNTIERLLGHEELLKFVKWVSKQPIDFYSTNRDTACRKKRRKR